MPLINADESLRTTYAVLYAEEGQKVSDPWFSPAFVTTSDGFWGKGLGLIGGQMRKIY